MADPALVNLVERETVAKVAEGYKVHDVCTDGPILLVAHGRPVLTMADFDDGKDGDTDSRVVVVRLRDGIDYAQCENQLSWQLPSAFTLDVPAVNPTTKLVQETRALMQ